MLPLKPTLYICRELLEKRKVPAAAVVDSLLNAVLFLKGVSYNSSVEFLQLDFLR